MSTFQNNKENDGIAYHLSSNVPQNIVTLPAIFAANISGHRFLLKCALNLQAQ